MASSSDEILSLELDLKMPYTDPPSSNHSSSRVVEPYSISKVGVLTDHGDKPEGIYVVLPGQADQYERPAAGSYGGEDNGKASSNDDQSKTLHGLSIPIPGVTTSAPFAPCAPPTPSEPSEPLIPEFYALLNSTQKNDLLSAESVSEKSMELAVNKVLKKECRTNFREQTVQSLQLQSGRRQLETKVHVLETSTASGKLAQSDDKLAIRVLKNAVGEYRGQLQQFGDDIKQNAGRWQALENKNIKEADDEGIMANPVVAVQAS